MTFRFLYYRYLKVECGEEKDTKTALLYGRIIKRYIRTLLEVCCVQAFINKYIIYFLLDLVQRCMHASTDASKDVWSF